MGARRTLAARILVFATVTALLAGTASATDNVTGNRWLGYLAEYHLDQTTLSVNFIGAIDRAAAKWTWPNTAIEFRRGYDVYHHNYWTNEHILWFGSPMPGCDPSWIACTGVIMSQGSMLIEDADTVFYSNIDYRNDCPAGWQFWLKDMETVALHELGHWGELGHTTDGNAVMRKDYDTCRQNLTPHDVQSMNANYGQ